MDVSISFTIIILIIVGYLYLLENGNPYNRYLVNKYVPVYLEEKGYTADEIKEAHYVQPKHLINTDLYQGNYMVIFKDELDITYYYGIMKKGKEVKQFCEKDMLTSLHTEMITTKTNHSEERCVNSLDNR